MILAYSFGNALFTIKRETKTCEKVTFAQHFNIAIAQRSKTKIINYLVVAKEKNQIFSMVI